MLIAASANTTEEAAGRPRVSVLLPAYNAGATLEAALRSVLGQTLTEIEVIVADDGSRDGTRALAEAVADRDPRVRVLAGSGNGGAAAARNRALAAARGDWLALLDADDKFEPDRLTRLISLGESRQADIVFDNLRYVAADGDDKGLALPAADRLFVEPLTAATFVRRNLFLTPSFKLGYLKPLFRRRFVEQHGLRQDETLRIAEDFHFLLDALMAGGRCTADPAAGYHYRLTPGSLSRELSLGDLQRLSAANHAVSLRAQADVELRQALEQRQRSICLNIAFMLFVEAVKRRQVCAAGSIFARHPNLSPFLAFYGLQSLRKRLPGGRSVV